MRHVLALLIAACLPPLDTARQAGLHYSEKWGTPKQNTPAQPRSGDSSNWQLALLVCCCHSCCFTEHRAHRGVLHPPGKRWGGHQADGNQHVSMNRRALERGRPDHWAERCEAGG